MIHLMLTAYYQSMTEDDDSAVQVGTRITQSQLLELYTHFPEAKTNYALVHAVLIGFLNLKRLKANKEAETFNAAVNAIGRHRPKGSPLIPRVTPIAQPVTTQSSVSKASLMAELRLDDEQLEAVTDELGFIVKGDMTAAQATLVRLTVAQKRPKNRRI